MSFYPLGVRLILFVASITLAPCVGTLRTRRFVIYTLNAVLSVCYPEHSSVLFLSTIHSLLHEHIPFIDELGLNVHHSATLDVLCHTLMHVWVMWLIHSYVSVETLFVMMWIFMGSIYNTVVSLNTSVDDESFIRSSVFQALSSGAWISLMGFGVSGTETDLYEPFLWGCLVFGMFNWYVFKNSEWVLARLFRASYFDTFFNVCVYLYVWNRQ
jgi:hypothetical protein